MAFFSSSSSHLRRSFSNILSSNTKLLPPNTPSSFINSKSPIVASSDRPSYPFVNSTGRPPLMVSSMDEIERGCPCRRKSPCICDDRHHLVYMFTNGLHYENEDQLYHDYVKALAPVVGSEKEAKKKIYLVSCGVTYGFGVELEKSDAHRLSFSRGVQIVCRDRNYSQRKLNPYVQLSPKFTPMNRDQRLENIFSYHYLSKEQKNKRWKDDHWLIALKQPATGFDNYVEIRDHIVQLLVKILGSEEEACKRIYVIWYKLPYGFGAEIDKEASEKLREMKDDVLAVLPDYAFDVKDEEFVDRALKIYPSVYNSIQIYPWIHGSRYSYCRQDSTGVEEESHEPIGISAKSDLAETSDCKHWSLSLGSWQGEGEVFKGSSR